MEDRESASLPILTIKMFGAFEAQAGGSPLPPLRTRKGQELLALLALRYAKDVEREWLSGILWPDSAAAQAAYNLRRSLSDLRQALGAAAMHLKSPTTLTLRFDLLGADVDIIRFDAAIVRGDMASLTEAVTLYRGPLLETCYEEWATAERNTRERVFLTALETLAKHHREAGEFDSAARWLQQVVAIDPTRETAQRRLMETLAAGGNYGAMVQTYRALRLYLHETLKTEPDSATTALYQRLQTAMRSATLPVSAETSSRPQRTAEHESVGIPPAAPPPSNLPRPLTSFIGREQEKAEVKRLLRQRPLLTLTGMGGSGKTRLSLEVAAEVLADYPDGVWLVELAPLADPMRVAQTTAAALGVREQAGTPLLQTLLESLQSKRLLLVLDNCEHLAAACADLVNSLLRSCPQVSVLANSREALGIMGEQLFRVPCLSLPALQQSLSWERLLQYEAIRLFVERAVLARPDFVITAANAPAVVSVCHRLDGLPLALELAAARVRGMGVEMIQTRLDDRFHLLTGGSRAALPRHQTLRALMDWSYDLLSEEERALLIRLSVFAGGWTLEAAERVAGEERGERIIAAEPFTDCLPSISPDEVMGLLLSLVDKSLVLAEERGGMTRYRLLETVQVYARERQEALGEAGRIRARHREWCAEFMETAWAHRHGAEGAVWLKHVDVEHDNLRLALGAANDLTSFRIAATLWWFWHVRGYWSEGRERLSRLLRADETGAGRVTERARMLWGAGMLADGESDYEAARTLCEEGLAIFQEIGDHQSAAAAMGSLGIIAKHQGDFGTARDLLEKSLRICQGIGDRHGMVTKLINLGNLTRNQGDYAAARRFYEESLELCRELGERQGMASGLNNLGDVARSQGDYDAALALYQESLTLYRGVGERKGIAAALCNLGTVAHYRKNDAAAQSLLEEGLQICREIGDRTNQGYALNELGTLARHRGDYTAARLLFEESLSIWQEIKHSQGIADTLERMAALSVGEEKAATN